MKRYNRRTSPPPEQSGLWLENAEGRRKTPRYSSNSFYSPQYGRDPHDREMSSSHQRIITLPNLYAKAFLDTMRPPKFIDAELRRMRNETEEKNTRRKPISRPRRASPDTSLLGSLPTEILLEILKYIVPTGRIFHFSPTACRRRPGTSISVHQVCQADRTEPSINISSLALTSQRLRDVSYGLLFGQNQIVIELATTNLTSEVQLDEDAGLSVEMNEKSHFLSWNYIWTPKSGSSNPPFPMTPSMMQHITDLTICISLSSRSSSPSERQDLTAQVESLVVSIEHSPNGLRRLAVSLDLAEKRYNRSYSTQLELVGEPLRMVLRDGSMMSSFVTTVRRAALDDLIAAPLGRLRDVGEVVVGGLLSEKFERGLREAVMKKREEDENDEGKGRGDISIESDRQ